MYVPNRTTYTEREREEKRQEAERETERDRERDRKKCVNVDVNSERVEF